MRQQIKYTTVWEPNSGPQSWLISCPVFETLFGGARGGGKSDGVLGEWADHANEYGENAIGLCVRRERTQLVELVERSKVLYFQIGAKFNEQDKLWRFPNGARLRFAYLESDNDAQAYQGHSYTRVYVEEMGTFANPEPIFKLMATLRSGAGVPCRFIATANPGGPGHSWIKKRYIDPAPLGMKILNEGRFDELTKSYINSQRIFIPSKLTDNPYINNKDYIARLYLAGNAELVKAWLLGDWNVMLGAFFPEFSTVKHVIRQFRIPKHWTRFMSMDWGAATPFSIGWWAVVPDEFDGGLEIYPDQWQMFEGHSQLANFVSIPKGAIIRYREWYGSKGAEAAKQNKSLSTTENMNVGLKLTAEEVAKGINDIEKDEPKDINTGRPKIAYRVGDPKMFTWDSGPSVAERMSNRPYYVNLNKADNKRVPRGGAMGGWDMVRARLKGAGEYPNSTPMIFFMENCTEAIRTLPLLEHDPLKMEDVNTDSEDHAPDDIRYACMSRPYSNTTPVDTIRRVLRVKDNTAMIMDSLEDLDNLGRNTQNYNPRIT